MPKQEAIPNPNILEKRIPGCNHFQGISVTYHVPDNTILIRSGENGGIFTAISPENLREFGKFLIEAADKKPV